MKSRTFITLISDCPYFKYYELMVKRRSPPEVLLGKGVLKTYSRFIGEHLCRSVTSIKLQSKVAVYFQNTFS